MYEVKSFPGKRACQKLNSTASWFIIYTTLKGQEYKVQKDATQSANQAFISSIIAKLIPWIKSP
jgi:hypothetical protein